MTVTTYEIRTLDELFGPAQTSTLQSLITRLQELDVDLWMHARLVTEITMRIADALVLDEADRSSLRGAAWLHDIGKLTVSRSLLDKPGPLDAAEWAEVRTHPARAADYLRESPELRPLAPVVLHHHERYDGAGYPAGLAGRAIPLGARILCVGDAFDAMTADRPYQRAMTIPAALDEVTRCAGSQFDPRVVDALISVESELPLEIEL
jgi:HD-GYP domain-containing protein (c-di-GMP phosphodiesterase class II)